MQKFMAGKTNQYRKGSALVTVLITVTVLSILGAAILSAATGRMSLSVSYESYNGALYAAQAGIEEMKLDISNKLDQCNARVKQEIETYIESPEYDPNKDLSAESKRLTKQYIFYEYLMQTDSATGRPRIFYKDLGERNASYSIEFAEGDYVSASGTTSDVVMVRSTGVYGLGGNTVSRTVTAQFRLDYATEDFEVVTGEGSVLNRYPTIVQGFDDSNFSLRANCRNLFVYGQLHLPKGIHDFGDIGNTTFEFLDTFTVDSRLFLDGDHKEITASRDFRVNGDLEFGTDSKQMVLTVNGNLVVNGDLIINGTSNVVTVMGDLYISGDIIIDGDKHCSLSYNSRQAFSRYAGGIPVLDTNFGDLSVFQDNPGVISTNYINQSYGSASNPVVIFCSGDLTIDLSSNSNINVYGLIYATRDVSIIGLDSTNKQFSIDGNVIVGRKLNMIGDHGTVVMKLNSSIVSRLDSEIVEYFGGTGIVTVPIVNRSSVTAWDE